MSNMIIFLACDQKCQLQDWHPADLGTAELGGPLSPSLLTLTSTHLSEFGDYPPAYLSGHTYSSWGSLSFSEKVLLQI